MPTLLAIATPCGQLLEGSGSSPGAPTPAAAGTARFAVAISWLGQLRWGASQGREFLEKALRLSPAAQHSANEQLLQFNMLLEGVLISVKTPPFFEWPFQLTAVQLASGGHSLSSRERARSRRCWLA